MSSRLNNQDIGLKICIQQRIDNYDLTGHLKKEQPELWAFLSLPADLSEGHKPIPATLEKYYVDGLMSPIRLNRDILRMMKMQLRTAYSGQYLQAPIVTGGRLFKEAWFQWFTKEQLPVIDNVIISVDGSLTDSPTACNASVQVWGSKRPNYYMLYDYTMRMTQQQTLTAIERMLKIYPHAICVIENAASGFFLIEKLMEKYPTYRFPPNKFGGKEIRADMISALWETGNVFVADNIHNKTVYQEEIISFPNSPFKDRVDAMSQALLYFTRCNAGDVQSVERASVQI
jgi:predicted phage terminase large subunit-like protein